MLARVLIFNSLTLLFAAPVCGQVASSEFPWDQIPNQSHATAFFSWENTQPAKKVQSVSGFDWSSNQITEVETSTSGSLWNNKSPRANGSTDTFISTIDWAAYRSDGKPSEFNDLPTIVTATLPSGDPLSVIETLFANNSSPIAHAAAQSTSNAAPWQSSLPEIELQPLAKQTNQEKSVEQIRVRPMKGLSHSDTSTPLKSSYSTENYIGPLGVSESLFQSLNISNRYQTIGGVRMEDVGVDSAATPFTWASPAFAHRPLYFEQTNLERYGIGHRKLLQPWASGMHFYGSVFMMPYKLLTQHPNEKVYTLGNQRPGDRVCYQRRTLLGQSYLGEVRKYWEDYSGY